MEILKGKKNFEELFWILGLKNGRRFYISMFDLNSTEPRFLTAQLRMDKYFSQKALISGTIVSPAGTSW